MNKLKKWLLSSGLLLAVFTLSGCVRRLKDGSPDPSGTIYRYMVVPLGKGLTYVADNWNLGFGWAIIVLTIVIRLILMPLMIHQSHKSMIQSEKMQYLKPQMNIAQENIKKAKTQEEQVKAQQDMQRIYKENDVSMLGGIGCLPLVVQMVIFSALFYTVSYTKGIADASFFGIDLGENSMVLVVIAGLSYVLQSFISMIGIPEDQKKQMRSMMFMSPIMIVFVSFRSPAGVVLYWVIGGIISCVQTFITNVLMKPKLQAKMAEEMKANPPKVVVTKSKDVTPETTTTKSVTARKQPPKNRNAGKQHHKK